MPGFFFEFPVGLSSILTPNGGRRMTPQLLTMFSLQASLLVQLVPLAMDGPNTHEDSLRAAIEAERASSIEWLRTSPTSYLAAVARVDFADRKTLTVGRHPSNDVVIEDPAFEFRHLAVTVVEDSFLVRTIAEGASFVAADESRKGKHILPASYIYVGRFPIRLSHQRYPAIIVFDPQSDGFGAYKGLEYYPVDPRYRFVLRMVRNPEPDTVVILSTRGNVRNALREGWFTFMVDSTPCRLEVTRLLEPGIGEDVYSIFFRDATSGSETYPIGRYLDVEHRPDGSFVLDFNRAYNPACAVSPYYNCPLPPEENTLPVPIRAGEKDVHYGNH